MPARKLSAYASAASAQASTLYPVVSGGNANKTITQHTMLQSLGIPQYVEATCRATATVAFLPLSSIFDVYVKVLVASSALAGGSNVNVGIGTQAQRFGEIETSGSNFYRLTNALAGVGGSFINVSGAIVAAAPTATAASSFVVGIGYFRT